MKPRTILQGLLVPVLILLVWEVGGRRQWWQPNLLPTPSDIGEYIVSSMGDGSLPSHIEATLGRLGVGFLLGLAAALAIGSLTGFSPLASRLVDPLIQGLRAIPSLAWVPLFLIWLGIGERSKVALIAVGVFFPIYLNLVAGFHGVDRKLIDVGRVHGLRPLALIRRIILPAALPSFLTGLRGGLGLGWMFVVAAELIGASKGLGFLLDYGRNISRPDIIFASIVLFAVLGKLTDAVLVILERRALRWQDTLGASR
jgi:sulfonate transport system permease protein